MPGGGHEAANPPGVRAFLDRGHRPGAAGGQPARHRVDGSERGRPGSRVTIAREALVLAEVDGENRVRDRKPPVGWGTPLGDTNGLPWILSRRWGIPMDFESIKAEVEGIIRLDLVSEAAREANGDRVLDVLRHLDSEIESVRQQANGYPANHISALVWMNGAGYGNLARALTQHFQNAGWLKREENASALWAKATLAVCSHYHHMVGPAMIANADCHDRLGNTSCATQMYGGVVQDFAFIADELLHEGEPPSDEDRGALEPLNIAAKRLLSRGIDAVGGIDVPSLRSKISKILSPSGGN